MKYDDSEAQKSEVHDSTADASTSPTAPGDETTTRQAHGAAHAPQGAKLNPDPPSPDTTIVFDDTDNGGPLVIKSSDPDLSPPVVLQDPFPTERKPEIDPPV